MSSTLVSILVSVIFALSLLISFFVGRKRGVGRTLVNGGVALAFLIAMFFLTPVITNAILGISVNAGGTETTLGNFLVEYAKSSSSDVAKYVNNSESLQIFLTGVVAAVASVLVFVILGGISRLLAFVVYKIIDRFGFPSKKQEEEEGRVRNKFGGGILSVVKTFLYTLVLLLPFTSMTQFVENSFFKAYANETAEETTVAKASFDETLDSLPSTAEISNEIPSEVKRIISGYNKSIVGLCGNAFGIGDFSFDYLSQIDVKGDKVSIRKTAVQLLGFYDYILDTYADYKDNSTDFFRNLDYTKFDAYKKEFLNDGMFKGFVLNLVADYAQNYKEVLPEDFVDEYGIILESVASTLAEQAKPNEYLLGDIGKLFDLVESAGKSGFLDDYIAMEDKNATDVLLLLVDKYSSTFVGDTINAVFSVNLVRDNFEVAFDKLEASLGDGDLENAIKKSKGKIENWDQFIFDMKGIMTTVGNLYHHIESSGVKVKDFKDDTYLFFKVNPNGVELILGDVGEILDSVNELEIMKDQNNTKILNDVLDAVGFGDLLKDVVAPEGTRVNYAYVMKKLAPAMKTLVEFDLYDEIKEGNYVDAICKIADTVYEDSTKSHDIGDVTKQEQLEKVFKIIYEIPKIKEITIDAFKDDLGSFVDISVLDDATTRDVELRNLTDILIQLSCNKITPAGETESVSFLRFLLTEGNDFEGLVDAIEEDRVKDLLSPILVSKMTDKVCETIFDTIKTTIIDLTGDSTITLEWTREKLIDQNDEICNVFKNFLRVHKENAPDVESVNKTNIGALLDSLRVNAYRVELSSKLGEGVFKDVFDKLTTKAEADYNISFKKVMGVDETYRVNFTALFGFVDTLEKDTSTFKTAAKELMNGGEITEEKVKNLLDSIDSANYDDVMATLNKAGATGVHVDVEGITVDGTTVEEAINSYNFTDASKGLTESQASELKIKLIELFS